MSYAWSIEEFEDNYSEELDTIEECIEEAKSMGCKEGTVIYIGKTKEPEIRGVELSSILEKVHETMCEDVGEVAEDWDVEDESNADPRIYKKYEDDINNLVVKYIEEIGMKPNFKEVIDIKPFIIKDMG